MFDRYRGLVQPGTAWRWIVVLVIALTVSALEALGALLVYTLASLATDPGGPIVLPFLGDIRTLAPGLNAEQTVIATAVGVALFFVARGVAILVQSYTQTRVATSAATALSVRLLDQYLRLPYAFHLRRNSSQLIRNAHESVIQVQDEVLIPLVRLIAHGTMVLGLLVVLFVTAPVAAGIATVLLVPSVALTMRLVQPRMGKLGATSQHESGRSIQLLQHSLHGFRDITVLGRQSHFLRAYRRSRRTIARTRYLRASLSELPRVVIESLTISLVAAFIVISTLMDGRPDSLAVIGLFAYAALRIMPALNKIMKYVNDMRYGRAALDIVQRDLQLDAPRHAPVADPLPFADRFVLEGVGFTYEGNLTPTLAEIDLVIKRGQSLGIVGVTGAGKSTLIDVMIGLSTPTIGRILVDQVPLMGHESAWQRNLGMVSQQVFLLDDTFRRNIALGVPEDEIDDDRIHNAVVMAQLDAFVTSLPKGLDTWIGERGVRVSGGQQQRIAIARALYPQPQVLFFDEGTSALDNLTEAAIIEALTSLRATHTIITVAHRLSTVQDHDQIVFLRDGRIEELGTFDELVRRSDAFRRLAKVSSAT